MAYCQKCGAFVEEGVNFCASCGAPVEHGAGEQNNDAQQTVFDKFNNTEDATSSFSPADIEANKVMAILSYINILVLIPIFAAKESPFARFHANQGLVLFLAEIVYGAVTGIINNIVGIWPIRMILSLVNILFVVLMIIGIVNAVNGKAKKLPIIGDITLIK